MRTRRNQIEIIEDSFAALPLVEQDKLLAVLGAMNRMAKRNGAALADLDKKQTTLPLDGK